MSRVRQIRAITLAFMLLAIRLPAPACGADDSSGKPPPTKSPRPNIILINLDDADRDCVEIDFLRSDSYRYLPNIDRMALEGLRFTNAHCTTPLCCPSRVSLFTGQYAYKHGVKSNDPTTDFSRGVTGGYSHFRDFGAFRSREVTSLQSEIGLWMQQAGYHTMFVGKYLHNGYEPAVGQTWQELSPPGWNEFFVSLGSSYFTTTFLENGKAFQLNKLESDRYPVHYRTAVEGLRAVEMIREHVRERENEFFLYIAPLAPHREAYAELCFGEDKPDCGMVEPQYRNWWSKLGQIRTPDFDELDVSDKPGPLRESKPLSKSGGDPSVNEILQTDVDFRRRVLSLRSVDDLIRGLFDVLEESNLADQTIIILTSDHGFQLGQNRIIGKKTPFHRCTNIPLLVWGPGYFPHQSTPQSHLLANIDIAPTILQLAESTTPGSVQGRSFLPLLGANNFATPEKWRPEGILIENWESAESATEHSPRTFASLRLDNAIYTQWSTGEQEYYDLVSDPYQLTNQIGSVRHDTLADLRGKLSALKQEMPQPESSIEVPQANGDVFLRSVNLSGLAEYKSPIGSVRLAIADITSPKQELYWNGSEWTGGYAYVNANLATKENLVSDWNYRFDPGVAEERRFRVTSRAVSVDGRFQQHLATKIFVIDADAPYCQFTFPKAEETVRFYKPIAITGWARDEIGIKSVRLTIRDTVTRRFWNGLEWQDKHIALIPRMVRSQDSSRVTWNYEFLPPQNSGMVYVNMRIYNMNNETETAPRAMRFAWQK